ncbi:MAG: NAD-dependent epimerase/dehydratase family protein [Janthinobacterium lividum]
MTAWHPPGWDPSWLTPARLYARNGFVRGTAQVARDAREAVRGWPRSPPPSAARDGPGAWVLVGGAGFLGARIAARLLGEDDDAPVVVVSRRPEAIADRMADFLGRDRVAALMASPRLLLVHADVARPADDWITCVPRADAVIHLAAAMHALARWDALAPANLDGLRGSVALARRDDALLQLGATLSVFVSSNAGRADRPEPLPECPDLWLHGGYAQTKAAAEYALLASGIGRRQVVRYGLLVPEPGAVFPPGHFAPAFARALRGVAALPDAAEQAAVDLTPVDAAVGAAIRLARAGRPGVYHCANPRSALLADVVGALAAAAGELPVVARATWRERVTALPAIPRTLLRSAFEKTRFLADDAARVPLLNVDLFQATHRRFVPDGEPSELPDPAELLPGLAASMLREEQG